MSSLSKVCDSHSECNGENTGCYDGICGCLKGYCYTGENCLDESGYVYVRRCALFIQLLLGLLVSWAILSLLEKENLRGKIISVLQRRLLGKRNRNSQKLCHNDFALISVTAARLCSLTIYLGQIILSFHDPLLEKTNYFLSVTIPLMLCSLNGTLGFLGCCWLKLAYTSLSLPEYFSPRVVEMTAASLSLVQVILVTYFGFRDLWEIGLIITGFCIFFGFLCTFLGGFYLSRHVNRYGVGIRMQLMAKAISGANRRLAISCFLFVFGFSLTSITLYYSCIGFSVTSLICIVGYEGILLSILMFLDKKGSVFSKSSRNLIAPVSNNVAPVIRLRSRA
mmetsp:Transcript_18358/g.24227  ORF Transcript_18358/g.24227 Transcript_18358/m.24227 type:complete len:337 (+) Transcript_18358:80-1090(+)